jgi:hypothetical protein
VSVSDDSTDITNWPVTKLDELGLAVYGSGIEGVTISFDGEENAKHGHNTADEMMVTDQSFEGE